jgi:hypothetical protein
MSVLVPKVDYRIDHSITSSTRAKSIDGTLKMISIVIWSGEQLLHRIHRRVDCIQP